MKLRMDVQKVIELKIGMKKLTIDQNKVLAEFCTNFAVAWLAVGMIPSILLGKDLAESKNILAASILWSGALLVFAIYLVRRKKRRGK